MADPQTKVTVKVSDGGLQIKSSGPVEIKKLEKGETFDVKKGG